MCQMWVRAEPQIWRHSCITALATIKTPLKSQCLLDLHSGSMGLDRIYLTIQCKWREVLALHSDSETQALPLKDFRNLIPPYPAGK